MNINTLSKLLLSAIFVSIIFAACEQQLITNTPIDTPANMEISEEERLMYESFISNEGNSDEDSDIVFREDPDDYSRGHSWMNSFIKFKSKDGDCSSYPNVEEWCYYKCPSNRNLGGEHFKFSKVQYMIVGSSYASYHGYVNKEISAGKPADDQYDSECYRTTAYSMTSDGENDYIYRLRYRRSGQDYKKAHWTSWKSQDRDCDSNTNPPNCYD